MHPTAPNPVLDKKIADTENTNEITNSITITAQVNTISQHHFDEATTQYLDNASTIYYNNKRSHVIDEDAGEISSSASNSVVTAQTDYLNEYSYEPAYQPQISKAMSGLDNNPVHYSKHENKKHPNITHNTRDRPPFQISIQQLDAYFGLTIMIIMIILTLSLIHI